MEEKTILRLDQLITIQYPELSRSQSKKFLDAGLVKLNGEIMSKASLRVDVTSTITVDIPKIDISDSIDMNIIYEDDDCIVIDKPEGLLSHSKGEYNDEASVASWLCNRLDINYAMNNRYGIVHRLDRLTSGLMICAKDLKAQKFLQKQFADRKVKKTYFAIVEGHLKNQEAIIDMPISRNPKKPQSFHVDINGKNALTKYKVIRETSKYSLVELKPTTGRTHQLRVHLAHIGHPIVGDFMYITSNHKITTRLFLHAEELEITTPNRERQIFKSKLPEEFDNFLNNDK